MAVIGLVGLVVVTRPFFRSLVNPVAFLSGSLATALAGQEIVLPQVPFGTRAAGLILGSCFLFAVGSVITVALNRSPPIAAAAGQLRVSVRSSRTLAAICVVVLVVLVVSANVIRIQVGGSALGHVQPGVFDRSVFWSGIEGSHLELFLRIVNLTLFLSAVLVVLNWSARGPLRRTLMIALFVSALVIAISTAARMGFILVLFIFGIHTLLTIQWRRSGAVTRSAAMLTVGAVLFVTLVGGVATRRYGSTQPDDVRKLEVAFFGGPSALSIVYDERVSVAFPGGFGLSFAGLMELVGLRERQLGVYSTTVYLIPSDPATDSNVFTGFLMVGSDFGFAGSLLFFLLLGGVVGLVEASFVRRPSVPRMLVLANFYLLLVSMPQTMLSYYNFWWAILALAPLASVVFTFTSERAPAVAASQLVQAD